jgi:uncharacterized protein (TIGR02246 family)
VGHETLLQELAISKLLARYCRALDDHRYDDVVECFTGDAVFETMGRTLAGREQIRAFFPPDGERRSRPDAIHVLSNAVAEVHDVAATAVSDWMLIRRGADGAIGVVLAGRYHDALVCEDGEWRLARRTVTALARAADA